MGEEWEGKRKMYGETKESGERMEARIENTEEERAAKEEKRRKEGEKTENSTEKGEKKEDRKKQEQRIEKKRIEKRRYKRGDKRETATREKTKERRQKRGGKSHCHCQRARYRYCGTASLRVRTISRRTTRSPGSTGSPLLVSQDLTTPIQDALQSYDGALTIGPIFPFWGFLPYPDDVIN